MTDQENIGKQKEGEREERPHSNGKKFPAKRELPRKCFSLSWGFSFRGSQQSS